ncbi:MAG: radical SAM-associated putative lipoprotein [Tidjanibacter sp.]|nr:radical SAM-associated putative lipoprotein [Tidjanibacter sp.]
MKRSVKNILLSMLGFSAAPILTACYGMPEPEPDQYWNKDFKGKVTNTDGAPIEGVKVYVGTREWHYPDYDIRPLEGYAPVMTDAKGEFNIHIGTVPHKTYFVAEDVDEAAGGGWFATTEEWLVNFDGTIEMQEHPQSGTNENESNNSDNEGTTNE